MSELDRLRRLGHATDIDASMGLAGVEAAQGAIADLKERQAAARRALVDFCLRALLEGAPLEDVMDAAGFDPPPPPAPAGRSRWRDLDGLTFFAAYFEEHESVRDPREAFAAWIAEEFKQRLLERPARASGPLDA
jgi:hypothetical protein